jgi:2-oxoglutarate dehydrogenase E2 component (dihydrolipoamide succinyltransferase)
MAQIVVPPLSESVVEATVSEWVKKAGDRVSVGDVVVILETDKVTLEVAADQAGIISAILAPEGSDVVAGQALAALDAADSATTPPPAAAPVPAAPAAAAPAVKAEEGVKATPVARNMAKEHGLDLAQVPASSGKVEKADVQAYLERRQQPAVPAAAPAPAAAESGAQRELRDGETREKLSRRRRTIARNLVEAQQIAAMLTTFNEIDMGALVELRNRRKDSFKERYGVSLGFNSFFVKATVAALKAFPRINAEIEGEWLISKRYYDIGIAVGAEEGLVVPVLRDADRMSVPEIEQKIKEYGAQVKNGTLPIEALRGGSFTITNGGVFGSMMSTPILNYPQVGILGLHAVKDRPAVVNGQIAIRPWMYIALTYDHRIVDGREAVQFLVRIKDLIEDPETLLLEA